MPESDVDGYLTVVQAADELAGLEEDLAAREQLQARILGRLDRLVRSGRIEQLEGLTPEMFLTSVHRRSGLHLRLLLTAVEVLGRMPATWCLFREGTLSWSQVCRIVSRVRRLPVDGQRHIDRRIAASRDDAVAGHTGPQRGKPTAIVHVDVADIRRTCAGQVELNVTGGGLPTITRRRLEQILSDDHDLRVVLFDGGRPLAVSDLIHAENLPTKLRIAVRARDRGCRFGSKAPPARTHIHHIDGRRHGHHPAFTSSGSSGPTGLERAAEGGDAMERPAASEKARERPQRTG